MHTLYLTSVLLHVLAAIVWVGGIAFLSLVVVPWLRTDGSGQAAAFLRTTGQRFSRIGWTCFALLLLTGSFNLYVRGVRFDSFTDPVFLGSAFGRLVVAKLVGFLLILGQSAVHDFVLGPRAVAALRRDPSSATAASLRRQASWLGRLTAVLALGMVAVAVGLVRGVPW